MGGNSSRMVLESVEAFGSGLSSMNDSFIHTGQHSPPRRAERSLESIETSVFGVLLRSYLHRSPPSTSDSSSSEKKHIEAHDEDLVKSPDDQMTTGRPESIHSGVSLKSDGSKEEKIHFKDRVSPRRTKRRAQRDKERLVDSDVSGVEEFNKFWDDLWAAEMARREKERMAEREARRDKESMATGRPESPDSDVSSKSDQSKYVSPSRIITLIALVAGLFILTQCV